MKRIGKCLLLFLTLAFGEGCGDAFAQNLVPNPSFEDYVYCPTNNGALYHCKDWVNCGATPDYDNACVGSGPFSVPYSTFGYQPAATGNAYCDVHIYSTTGFYREYIGVPLTQSMTIGRTYRVSLKCSPGTFNGYSLLSNKLGIRFSTTSYDSVHTAPTDNFAHIYTDSIISDTTNWTTISGYFIADSTYTFLTIGNFFDQAHTNSSSVLPNSFFAVYFIDDVEVIDSTTGIIELSSEGDIKIIYQENEVLFISETEMKNIEFFNDLGQLIETVATTGNQIHLQTESLNKGIYFVRVQTSHSFKSIKLLIN